MLQVCNVLHIFDTRIWSLQLSCWPVPKLILTEWEQQRETKHLWNSPIGLSLTITTADKWWLSHGKAAKRFLDRYGPLMAVLDVIDLRKQEPIVQGLSGDLIQLKSAMHCFLVDILQSTNSLHIFLQESGECFRKFQSKLACWCAPYKKKP